MLYVVVPAYNEGKRIGKVIEGIKKYTDNIVVVDDGSRDNTYDAAKEHGVVVLRHITRVSENTPIIVVSGTGRIGDSIQALRLGAWDYILKPIDKNTLKLRLKEIGLI